MSSSNKTNYLGLNQFVGSDKPKMEDFNADNRLLDEKIQQHIQSQLHLTEQQRERLENPGYLIGSYTGDGTTKRTISVAQAIGSGLCYGRGRLHYAVTTLGENHIFSAVMTPQGCSKGSASQAEDLPYCKAAAVRRMAKRICSIRVGRSIFI